MANAPPRFLKSVHEQFPDDDTIKQVYLQADGQQPVPAGEGDRHVLLHWVNAGNPGESVYITQVIQLTGQSGNYRYYAPVVKYRGSDTMIKHLQFLLGDFTRAQRDQILQLASEVQFLKTSTVNGCRVWTRDLLLKMVTAGLLSQAKFNEIDVGVPLIKRKPEAK